MERPSPEKMLSTHLSVLRCSHAGGISREARVVTFTSPVATVWGEHHPPGTQAHGPPFRRASK